MGSRRTFLGQGLPYDVVDSDSMRLRIIGIPAGQRRVMELVAVGLLGLAILLSVAGIVLRSIHRGSPPHVNPRSANPAHPRVLTPPANPSGQPPSVPETVHLPVETRDGVVEAVPVPLPKPDDKPTPPEAVLKDGFQLRSRGPVAVLAEEEEGAEELRKDPGRLGELVQSGRLFSAPNHTTVIIEVRHDNLVRVRILDPGMLDRVGWIRADQVTAR
jgi:hypothetical protein